MNTYLITSINLNMKALWLYVFSMDDAIEQTLILILDYLEKLGYIAQLRVKEGFSQLWHTTATLKKTQFNEMLCSKNHLVPFS